jgi:hypothetical protein
LFGSGTITGGGESGEDGGGGGGGGEDIITTSVDTVVDNTLTYAIADGDKIGRGTGGDLDVYNQNAGTSTDIIERKDDLKINKFSSNNPYYTVT